MYRRKNGYRGEPSQEARLTPLRAKQRLCLALMDDGKRCVEPRGHQPEDAHRA